MNRREFMYGASAAASAAALATRMEAERGKRPNLVYVFADQLRYASCGYAGDQLARTPNMDRLAAEGANYHQAVSSTPVCAPYRASLMTGKYQSSTGMVINELRLSPEHECFGHVLTRAGYQTAYVGKWHLWAAQQGHHDLIKNGFTPPGAYRLGFDDYWAAYNFNHIYYHSPYFLNDATPHIRSQYEPDAQTDVAIDYLRTRRSADKPFALFLSWGPPHYPWGLDNVPPEYAEQFRQAEIPLPPNYTTVQDPYADEWQRLPADYDRKVHEWLRVYYAQVANLDWNLGRLMKALEETGLAGDTVFVFTSDHGEMFGAHGRQAKLIFYEEAARVPFLVRWPGRIAPKTKTDALLGTPDIMPTLLAMMGLPIPATVEGTNLSAPALGTGRAEREAAYLQGMGATAAWVDGTEWRALRDHEFTYAVYHKDGRELLFNNRADPYQMTDLAGERAQAARLSRYREMLGAWRREQHDEFHECSWYQGRWTENRNITSTAKGVGQDLAGLERTVAKWFPGGIGERSVGVPAGL